MKCSFTGEEIPPGTGVMYVKKDGKILWFGSSKAKKNMLGLGRKANKQAWTEEGRASKKIRLASLKHEESQKSAKSAKSAKKVDSKDSKQTAKSKTNDKK